MKTLFIKIRRTITINHVTLSCFGALFLQVHTSYRKRGHRDLNRDLWSTCVGFSISSWRLCHPRRGKVLIDTHHTISVILLAGELKCCDITHTYTHSRTCCVACRQTRKLQSSLQMQTGHLLYFQLRRLTGIVCSSHTTTHALVMLCHVSVDPH